jgi:hypothetical protein
MEHRNSERPARRLGALLVALAALIAVGGTAILPAHAEDRRDWRRDRHEERRDRDWRWHHEHPYAYAPPPVVYAPPVVAPSLNFVFPLHIH